MGGGGGYLGGVLFQRELTGVLKLTRKYRGAPLPSSSAFTKCIFTLFQIQRKVKVDFVNYILYEQ